jgi:multiple sugar transport system permease protein
MAWVWRWFYQPPPVGAFNVWLTSAGLAQMPFLRSTTQALPAVLAPAIWAGIGFQIVIFLAGSRRSRARITRRRRSTAPAHGACCSK